MPTPLPTLVSAAGNLTLDTPRLRPRPAASEPAFSRMLSEKRRPEPPLEPRGSAPAPAAEPAPRAPELDRPAAAADGAAREPKPSAGSDATAQPAARDAQETPAPQPDAGGGRATDRTATENAQAQAPAGQPVSQAAPGAAAAAQQAAVTGVMDPGGQSNTESQNAVLPQSPAPAATPPQAFAPQAPAGPGVHFETAAQTAPLAAPVPVAGQQDTAPDAGGEQARGHARSSTGSAADDGQQPKASTGVESGKGFGSASESGPTGGPALGRAAQVQTAVGVENLTGHAPVAQATTAAGVTASSLTAAAEGQPSGAPNAQPQDQPNQLINRVVRGLSAMLSQRGGTLNMRLEPPELGQLRVQMTIARGVVTAQFQPATAEVQAILDRSLATLRTALESHGLAVERLSVHGVQQQAGGTAARDAGEDQSQQQRGQHDAGHGQSRGRHDGQGEAAPRRFALRQEHGFEMPQPAGAAAGADEP